MIFILFAKYMLIKAVPRGTGEREQWFDGDREIYRKSVTSSTFFPYLFGSGRGRLRRRCASLHTTLHTYIHPLHTHAYAPAVRPDRPPDNPLRLAAAAAAAGFLLLLLPRPRLGPRLGGGDLGGVGPRPELVHARLDSFVGVMVVVVLA